MERPIGATRDPIPGAVTSPGVPQLYDQCTKSLAYQPMPVPPIIDGHLDLAANAIKRNRDQLKPVEAIRERERELFIPDRGPRRDAPKSRGVNTVSLPAMARGGVGLAFGTANARVAHPSNNHNGYDGQELCAAAARGQVAYYEVLAERGDLRMITDRDSMDTLLSAWDDALETSTDPGELQADHPPIGIVLAMEGADPILSPDHVSRWWDRGLRVVSLSHYGRSTYAHGTGTEGGLTEAGPPLLRALDDAGMLLDLTHLADQAFWEAIDVFDGPVLASHNNARELVPGQRQFTDEQLTAVIDRGGVIGVSFDVWMLQPGWTKGVFNQVEVTLEAVVDQIDHICSLAGDTRHVAIGSDLDGGYGREQVPRDLDTIADLRRIPGLLRERGYDDTDIERITHGNWRRLLVDTWA